MVRRERKRKKKGSREKEGEFEGLNYSGTEKFHDLAAASLRSKKMDGAISVQV